MCNEPGGCRAGRLGALGGYRRLGRWSRFGLQFRLRSLTLRVWLPLVCKGGAEAADPVLELRADPHLDDVLGRPDPWRAGVGFAWARHDGGVLSLAWCCAGGG